MHLPSVRAHLEQQQEGRWAPVIVVEEQEGVVSGLISTGSIRDGRPPAARIHTPHPELHCYGQTGPIGEVGRHHHLSTAATVHSEGVVIALRERGL